eukprot:910107_1
MKYEIKAIAMLMTLSGVSAFAPNTFSSRVSTNLFDAEADVVTGPDGKAARTKEEDLALTLAVIMGHDARSVTVTEEQFVAQQTEEAAIVDLDPIDVSIPYSMTFKAFLPDANAMIAYEASDKSVSFDEFKPTYLADTVAYIKSKQPVDVSIAYDANAKLAYEASDKSMTFKAFLPKYLEDTVAYIRSKQPIDVSIPYDANAKIAYEASDKSMTFKAFLPKYLEDTVAYIKSKQPADVSIPYDANAKIAYEASDKSMTFKAFLPKYLEDTVAYIRSSLHQI